MVTLLEVPTLEAKDLDEEQDVEDLLPRPMEDVPDTQPSNSSTCNSKGAPVRSCYLTSAMQCAA